METRKKEPGSEPADRQALEEHAGKVAAAAGDGRLPKVNGEIGEMAESCAKCHDIFPWGGE